MIRNFKFLTDNNDELEFGGFVHDLHDGFASWMWTGRDFLDRDPNWVEEAMTTTSIRTFLMNFPERMIVPILSITGDNITMTIDNDHTIYNTFGFHGRDEKLDKVMEIIYKK